MDVRVRYPGESEGLNNWIARETTRVPVSRYSKLHLAVHEVSSAASAASSVSDKDDCQGSRTVLIRQ